MKGKHFVVLLSLVILTQSLLVGWQFSQLRQGRNEGRIQTCIGISKLDDTLIGLIRASEKSLPSLQYYKEHPDDLVKVLNQDERAITALTPPKYC